MNNGGNTPIGYLLNRETKKLELDPLTAPLVREVFDGMPLEAP